MTGSCRCETRSERELVLIHHVSVGTNDVERSKSFYDAVLPILGIVPMAEDGKHATVGNGTHIAFAVEDRSMVNRFYAAALKHGGSDDGAPGLRPNYDANYYGAFGRDPDDHKIEVVTYSAK